MLRCYFSLIITVLINNLITLYWHLIDQVRLILICHKDSLLFKDFSIGPASLWPTQCPNRYLYNILHAIQSGLTFLAKATMIRTSTPAGSGIWLTTSRSDTSFLMSSTQPWTSEDEISQQLYLIDFSNDNLGLIKLWIYLHLIFPYLLSALSKVA